MSFTSSGSTGWTGMAGGSTAPGTVERRRKGRNVDVIGSSMPTPPQSRHYHLPTPETVRRPAKQHKFSILENQTSTSTSAQLPTPQTQRHRRRNSPSSSQTDPTSPPSPSGHTTFFLSSSAASTSRPEKIRRRPGLTFAQQMGLLSNPTSSRGVGVGIGGHKNVAHGKVDQIGGPIPKMEDNPFLVTSGVPQGQTLGAPVGLASPGAITMHQPRSTDYDDEEGQPLCSPDRLKRRSRLASPSPSKDLTKAFLSSSTSTGLLSPPPTFHAPRIGVITGGKTQALTRAQKEQRDRRRRAAEEHQRMLDAADNPFLVKAGEPSTRRPGPIVNEDIPTVTYVFRGAKKVFANPLYPSRAPFPQAELSPEDDDFEPHPLPQPKLLWPSGPSPSKRVGLNRDRTPSPDLEVSPPSSPVSTPTMMRRFVSRQSAEDEDELRAGPKDVFTDEEVIIGHEDDDEHEDGDEAMPIRRGLLFGGGSGLKRGLDGDGDRKSKKARGVLRL
ncbi:hypothetical protein IAR55_005103 [Kwoniella newhampshirensis]|uniref:Uncharacterized protein n=1 Tax=Kwoniella newhampshirensis TaxID=1651941 RepID=A0AAW0YWI1_9TREE